MSKLTFTTPVMYIKLNGPHSSDLARLIAKGYCEENLYHGDHCILYVEYDTDKSMTFLCSKSPDTGVICEYIWSGRQLFLTDSEGAEQLASKWFEEAQVETCI